MSQFCDIKISEQADSIINQIKQSSNTNKLHSELLLLKYAVKENLEKVDEAVIDQVSNIDGMLHCYVLKNEILAIHELIRTVKSDSNIQLFEVEAYTFEPGFHHWRQKSQLISADASTSMQTKHYDSVEGALATLSDIVESEDVEKLKHNLPVIDRILDYFLLNSNLHYFQPEHNDQLFNSEFVLDLLDAVENVKVDSIGSSVAGKTELVRSLCLGSMLSQAENMNIEKSCFHALMSVKSQIKRIHL